LDPHAEYSRRLEVHTRTIAAQERLHVRAGYAKVTLIFAGLLIMQLALGEELFSLYWLLIPIGLYTILVFYHERVLRARARANIAAEFYRKGLARIEDRWAGTGESGKRFRDPKHPHASPYADDLDIFGRGCLFELVCTARMPMGQDRLAHWLSGASAQAGIAAEIIQRQKSAAELRDKLDLREHLAVTGETLRSQLEPEALTLWAEASPAFPMDAMALGALRWICAPFTLAAVTALGIFLATRNFWPLVIVLVPETVLWQRFQKRAKVVAEEIACNADGLALFSKVLMRLESERFQSPQLRELVAQLRGDPPPASQAVGMLARIVYWMDAREGMLGHLLDVPALFTVQTALAAEAWRRKHGARMRAWIGATAEIEALLSLAGYSYEHPADPFPEFVAPGDPAAGGSPALFDGRELGHPLIPAKACVRNSVRLDAETQVLLVSGSNMSGKSTFLRTVGINAVLAMAGAPIRGAALRMTPLTLGTRIRSTDSLQENRSNFYTEILRIREVIQLAEARPPVLFLFDELLEGTNSADRRVGAEALIGGMLHHGAIGIVTTHDLALTEICALLGGRMRNSHFQDYVENGEMRFDYKLRDGIVEKSNAVEMMRLIGWKI
jgi:hypothetical protein